MNIENATVKYFRIGKVDEKARVVGTKELDPEKLPYEHLKYYYDDKGRVVRFEKYERDFPRPVVRTYKYEGDSPSVKESEWFDRFGNLRGIHRYECDAKGFMVRREELDADRNLKYYIKSKYDEKGRLIEEAWYNPDDTLEKRDVLGYDDDESMDPAWEEKYDAKNEHIGTFYYKYDDRGNLIEKKWYNAKDELQSYYKYKYNDDDLLIWLALYDENDNLQMYHEFEYDKVGNKITEKLFTGDGTLAKIDKWPGVTN